MKKILLTSLLCSVSLFSASNPSNLYSYEVTPFASGILTDSNAGLDDNHYLNAGIALGKNLDDSFIDQIEIAYMRSDSLEYEGTNGNTNINRAFLNAVKKFALTEKLSAYGLLGAGYQDVSQEIGDNEDSALINYGLGLRYDIPYYGIALKGDVRHLLAFKNTQNSLMYTFGLALPLGKKYSESITATVPVVNDPIVEEAPVEKSIKPQPMDDDKDGVLNQFDKCPNTSAGVKVNKDGCFETVNLNINFDNNSVQIKDQYMKNLQSFAKILKENKSLTAVIEAHTDAKGSDSYNQNLSDRRAVAVVNELKKLDIESMRLTSRGYGESQPIASNDNEEGRALNRRVTALINR
ncbi:OmpA family protein [Arcobacter sp. s6]|jgi:OmpA-OmpF porin, OOP family|uniref:OmpA family protein n=1 Tax=Arcobacter sp. s6 TaxID=3230363 RepID=UPI0034A03161